MAISAPGALGIHDVLRALGIQHQVIRIPATAGYTQIIDTPGFLVRGWIGENFSPYALYLNYSQQVPSLPDAWDHRVEPFFKESETAETRRIAIRVDTLPDGTTGISTISAANQYLRLTLLDVPVAPTSMTMLGPAAAGIASNVTVTQLPTQTGLADALANPTTTEIGAFLEALNAGGTWDRLRAAADDIDAQAAVSLGVLRTLAVPVGWTGAGFDRLRTPKAFASQQAFAIGSTVVVAGVAGQAIRLMRYRVSLTQNATLGAAGIVTVKFLDAATDLNLWESFYVPAAGTLAHAQTGWVDLGNGVVCAAGDALNVNLSVALNTGLLTVTVAYLQGAAV